MEKHGGLMKKLSAKIKTAIPYTKDGGPAPGGSGMYINNSDL